MTTDQNDQQPNVEGPEGTILDMGLAQNTLLRLPEIEVFKHANFNFKTSTIELLPGEAAMSPGRNSLRTSFNVNLKGDGLDNNISAIIIYGGRWEFFDSEGNSLAILTPGQYADVRKVGIPNDKISS